MSYDKEGYGNIVRTHKWVNVPVPPVYRPIMLPYVIMIIKYQMCGSKIVLAERTLHSV